MNQRPGRVSRNARFGAQGLGFGAYIRFLGSARFYRPGYKIVAGLFKFPYGIYKVQENVAWVPT